MYVCVYVCVCVCVCMYACVCVCVCVCVYVYELYITGEIGPTHLGATSTQMHGFTTVSIETFSNVLSIVPCSSKCARFQNL